jgi:protein TonB
MYADHLRARRIDPVGLTGAALIGGAILAALINVAPHIVPKIDKGLTWVDIHPEPIPTPVPDIKKEAKARQPTKENVATPDPLVTTTTPNDFVETTKVEPLSVTALTIGKAEPVVEPPVAPPPPMIGAEVDPRYADDFQPPYPSDRLRDEAEGRVTVRVQIGADGRVKAIEPVGKADTSFFDATRRQALSRWRFMPATRGGVAVESWKTMTVRFEIH